MVKERFYPAPEHPARLSGPSSLPLNGYRG